MPQAAIRVIRTIVIEGPESWVSTTLDNSIKVGHKYFWGPPGQSGPGYVMELERKITNVYGAEDNREERDPFVEAVNG